MDNELLPHLFRSEFQKIAAVLCKRLGIEHIETAEDLASETFLAALQTWPYRGLPENPTAWLYTVAKNKARNYLTRTRVFRDKVAGALMEPAAAAPDDIDLSGSGITDSQLQMLFAICHPALPAEAQIGLALRILCGFGIEEIATALLSNKEAVHKRLQRAREKLRSERVPIAFPAAAELPRRMDGVLRTLYLLFNEGYYSESQDTVLREDLCLEAMRLTYLLLEHPATRLPEGNALMALMCFHASRFEARKNESGEIILYADQDERLWNQELIARGAYFINLAAEGNQLTKYHLEANIAWWHTQKEDTNEKWENILRLYNELLILEYSPIAALNRTYALAKVRGPMEAIRQAEQLQLVDNPFYFALLGELYLEIDRENSKIHFEHALALSRTEAGSRLLQKRLDALQARDK